MPAGADAVQKIELSQGSSEAQRDSLGQWDSGTAVTILEPTKPGKFIVYKGSETKKGETVLRAGSIIVPPTVPPLAAFGFDNVSVGQLPRVSIMATGSEIVGVNETPGIDQIRARLRGQVPMCIDEAGHQCATLQVDHLGPGAFQLHHVGFGTDGDDPAACFGDGFDAHRLVVHREDRPAGPDAVGGLRSGSRHGRQ